MRLTLEAKSQLRELARGFEQARRGHGSRFVEAVRRLLGLVTSFPKMGVLYYSDIRRLIDRKYSCLVLYRVLADEIVVVKFTDARREPEVIQGELDA